MNDKTKNITLTIINILLEIATISLAFFFLWKYEYIQQFTKIDNFFGMLPVAIALGVIFSVSYLIWLRNKKEKKSLTLSFIVLSLIFVLLFPISITGYWFSFGKDISKQEDWDSNIYTPFTEGNRTFLLDEESTLTLHNNLPIIDGALALYTLYSSVVETVYDEDVYKGEAMFTNTLQAFRGLVHNERDLIISSNISESQRKYAEENGANIVLTPIGKEAFVFLVGEENPVNNITYQEIKNIYSGKTQNWKTLGYDEGGEMICFQRPDGSGSQTALEMIMKGMPITKPRPLPLDYDAHLDSLILSMSNKYHGVQNSLGYSYRYFVTTMYENSAKIISVDGVYPSVENIKNGSYPYTVNFYAITNGEPTGNTKLLIDWLLSEQGQKLIELNGYVPL